MYQRILVPIDGSPTAERGLLEAIGLARVHGARLHVLHLLNERPMYADMAPAGVTSQTVDGIHARGERVVAKAAGEAARRGVEADTRVRETTTRSVAEMIVAEARDAGCDLIVMGTHGRRGLNRLAMGSDADAVVRRAPVPVLLVRQAESANA